MLASIDTYKTEQSAIHRNVQYLTEMLGRTIFEMWYIPSLILSLSVIDLHRHARHVRFVSAAVGIY